MPDKKFQVLLNEVKWISQRIDGYNSSSMVGKHMHILMLQISRRFLTIAFQSCGSRGSCIKLEARWLVCEIFSTFIRCLYELQQFKGDHSAVSLHQSKKRQASVSFLVENFAAHPEHLRLGLLPLCCAYAATFGRFDLKKKAQDKTLFLSVLLLW